MEIMSLQINPMASKVLPISCQTRPTQRSNCNYNYKFKTISISCKLAMHEKGQKSNFYEVLSLGTSETVGFEEIKKAYRRIALQYHPDVCPSSMKDESTKRFVELQKAYETLSDPVSRRMYDHELGLVDNFSLGFASMEDRKANFPKEVWERQLYGLKQRSAIRMQRKQN